MASSGRWYDRCSDIQGVLLDISGVLYDSGATGGVAIPGSVEAVTKLKQSGLSVRFCTNETQCTRDHLVAKLSGLGFQVTREEVFSPAPAACLVLKDRNLRPHLLIHPDCQPEFEGVDCSNPNCVLIGDATDEFSYKNLNEAFRVLVGLQDPILISMGKGRYYKETDGLTLDVGVFMKALEYACDVEAEVVGKPAKAFFLAALQDMGVQPQQAMMVGDDVVNDIGGAQSVGMLGLQVRTGKYRPEDEHHPTVHPDGFVDNLKQAVDLLLQHRGQ
ncbi:PREDICTED: phospholysine phosphohistidine inorganic pyrophosphate phosphatase-like [Branchiostoma belcheri]|uniref:Phospholysine phosphohistidine inorganic pyrophosphate phosphatase n=1 Tax=Branchiostoma belcheri TaxID=7741 RepID=A0A6P4ZFM3_BRABE|nr:PREDICTED: phospholysine phosphohistidine inorganic pyrophosphate phosphatase-like [Branchiostoma belcheri]